MIPTHRVYIVDENGGAPIQKEVIFPEELEVIIRPLIVELTVCRESFRSDAKQYQKEGRLSISEIHEERVQRVEDVLNQFNLHDLNGNGTEVRP